ncbi:sialomucin core protein 24-like [Physella acuta]|uniref:sialomucin core protein 24-like n=1 Tax=Physella acuta TaxID=109671 RepID=UPI0027DBAFF0|nr:sialomucin core protein 24-like [Physella acuta]XP_059153913.1 sialomucin core protein 24-like [Physella acuta]
MQLLTVFGLSPSSGLLGSLLAVLSVASLLQVAFTQNNSTGLPDNSTTVLPVQNGTGEATTVSVNVTTTLSANVTDVTTTASVASPESSNTTSNGTTSSTAPDVTNSTSTPAPGTSQGAAESSGGQHFDGASFIGGIVLCAGLVAIIFFGLKFYNARKDQNYHTL